MLENEKKQIRNMVENIVNKEISHRFKLLDDRIRKLEAARAAVKNDPVVEAEDSKTVKSKSTK